jgi:hypothetical protein
MDILILFKILQVALQNRFAVFPILPSDIDPMTESPLDLIDVSSMILWRTRWELCLPVQLGLRRADLRCFWRRLVVFVRVTSRLTSWNSKVPQFDMSEVVVFLASGLVPITGFRSRAEITERVTVVSTSA